MENMELKNSTFQFLQNDYNVCQLRGGGALATDSYETSHIYLIRPDKSTGLLNLNSVRSKMPKTELSLRGFERSQ